MDYEERFDNMDYDVLYDIPYDEMDYVTNYMSSYTLYNLWEDCLVPTITDAVSAVYIIFLCSLFLRFTSSLGFLHSSAIHVSSGCLGIYCLYHLFSSSFLYVIVFGLIGYLTILLTHRIIPKYCGVITAVMGFFFIILGELIIVDHITWHKIRGSQMILAMKLISLAFDVRDIPLPSLDECFGYLFCVGTVIFGPWVSFSAYRQIFTHHTKLVSWALRIFKCAILGFAFLTVSTCWSSWFLQFTEWKWLGAYRDALSFRSSHYFVCFISEALAIASGISTNTESWELPLVLPHMIELPRSLVEVVICWNLPMHSWLKNYVFKPAKPLGNFAAVLLTYVASSLLHGLNFQLAAVLLSLGFYTYIEHVLRKKLSKTFDACILARKCKKECSHKHKSLHPFVVVTNIMFTGLAMFHLAYLGVMFDSSSSTEEEGYNMYHTLSKWSELNFASHWVATITYVFYVLV